MAFPSTPHNAPSSVALLNVFKASASARNGDFAGLPKLSNGDLAQLADYYRARGASGWDKLARIALGFFEEGDKFRAGTKFDPAHVRDAVPASELAGIWARALGMSTSIDVKTGGAAESFTPRAADNALFDSIASDAFKILQRERGRVPAQIPSIPKKLPPPLDKIPDAIIPKKPGGDFGLAVIVVLVLVALSYRKGK